MSNILVVAAHPDDEILGCGGTMAKHSEKGDKVYVIILGEGVSSRSAKRELANKEEIKALRSTAKKACKAIGVRSVFFNSLPDNRFDSVEMLDITKYIEMLVDRICPDIVYTHNVGDLNLDHTITFRAVLTALRPMEDSSVKELYSFEVPSATDWSFGRLPLSFIPNTFVDINSTIEKKIKALKIYASEMRSFPHPRSIENVAALAQNRGAMAGFRNAEAFSLIYARR